MSISIIDHSSNITSKVVGAFEEIIPVRAGFSALFPEETTGTLAVDVEVQRDNDLIAVDVVRFTEGNKNKSTRATEHKYVPPFFKEDYDFNRDEVYQHTISMGVLNNAGVNKLIAQSALKNVTKNRAKIERAIRKQQAEVLQTGIVTLKNGDNIDFKRKALSMPVLSGVNLWSASATAKPIDDLALGMRFLRDVGNSNGADVNVVMRSDSFNAFMAAEQVKEQAEWTNIKRMNIDFPQFNEATGLAFQGQIAAGDFNVNLWTYNEKYTDSLGATKFYLDANKVVMIPSDFMGKTIFGGLPVMNDVSIGNTITRMPGIVEANYLIRAYSDERTMSSTLELSSAPIVVPFTVDKIYTIQTLT